jgi:hypothetical protein
MVKFTEREIETGGRGALVVTKREYMHDIKLLL